MVAVIHTSRNLRRAFNYNEQKVKEGKAECILAGNYVQQVEALTISQKLNRLLKQASLNERTKVNSVHISLNFDPSEQLPTDRLKEIATAYLEKIGFGEQPFLVYQHHDAAHPHVHLVTTNIQPDGKRISLHNLGKNVSEIARQEIEQSFGLVKAKDHSKRQLSDLEPVSVQKVQYGKSETRRAIGQVLNKVLQEYKYTSLPELNAVLRQYNVEADRGSEHSKMYQHRGLLYRLLDEQGNRVGVPIKASAFYQQPTLKYLESKFKLNQTAREPSKVRVKNAVDLTFLKQPNISLAGLKDRLKKEGISLVLQLSKDGRIYGITYVDHRTKGVYKGSDLGKKYSAPGIQERCGIQLPAAPNQTLSQAERIGSEQPETRKRKYQKSSSPQEVMKRQEPDSNTMLSELNKILEAFLQPEQTFDYVPQQLKNYRKKKRQRRLGNH
ncbi:relaxase/mobilization nuclease domain-containing protein [Adhaeribacter rhizoryzae]|uniref:Relaxase/mobilization nuclease domain-containing protein n=1 Tax=Adhaeribacter rhizoryzae TaxID=2607907 RepID=A0A5M6DRS4_9BACT|nr:relaxase/mobilization nuclease domain-containing protein [Adhaeribacter rhizoryzae]KAA5548105.1 relaxase/mobilization nuclease domain-containing protein [Adhaeribacter rhizoryzae]